MSQEKSQESVDAIRQILFGQEKRVLEDTIASVNTKVEKLTAILNQQEIAVKQQIQAQQEVLLTKVKTLEAKLSEERVLNNQLIAELKNELTKTMQNNAEVNKQSHAKLQQHITQNQEESKQLINQLETSSIEKMVTREQMVSVFTAIANHFDKTKVSNKQK